MLENPYADSDLPDPTPQRPHYRMLWLKAMRILRTPEGTPEEWEAVSDEQKRALLRAHVQMQTAMQPLFPLNRFGVDFGGLKPNDLAAEKERLEPVFQKARAFMTL